MTDILIFIRKIFLFSLFSFCFYIGCIILYGFLVPEYFHKNLLYKKFAYGFSNTRFKEAKLVKNIDILFLGSSRSYRHYDPRNFNKYGYTSFNLGSSAQTFIQTEILVNRYLNSFDPEYVILDVYPEMFSKDGVESSFDIISNSNNGWDTLDMVINLQDVKVFNSWIFAIFQEYIFNSLEDREKLIQGKNRYISGGYVQREISYYEGGGSWNRNYDINNHQWEAFLRIVNLIKKCDINLFIVHSPRNRGYNYEGEEKLV